MATRISDVFLQHNRLSEWAAAFAMIGFAAVLMTKGNSFTQSSPWSGFASMGATEISIAVPLMGFGVMRVTALWINGRWRRSPLLRATGAVAGFACFTTLTVTLMLPWLAGEAKTLSTGVITYAVLAGLDLIAASRAGADVGAYKRDHARTMAVIRDAYRVPVSGSDGSYSQREERPYRARRQTPASGPHPVFTSRRSDYQSPDGRNERPS